MASGENHSFFDRQMHTELKAQALGGLMWMCSNNCPENSGLHIFFLAGSMFTWHECGIDNTDGKDVEAAWTRLYWARWIRTMPFRRLKWACNKKPTIWSRFQYYAKHISKQLRKWSKMMQGDTLIHSRSPWVPTGDFLDFKLRWPHWPETGKHRPVVVSSCLSLSSRTSPNGQSPRRLFANQIALFGGTVQPTHLDSTWANLKIDPFFPWWPMLSNGQDISSISSLSAFVLVSIPSASSWQCARVAWSLGYHGMPMELHRSIRMENTIKTWWTIKHIKHDITRLNHPLNHL